MTTDPKTLETVLAENRELRYRLEEAEETLRAIQSGEVDALVVSRPEGEQIYTLQGADYSYRVLVETMNEGAATLSPDGTILYCNNRLAAMLHLPLEKLIGTRLVSLVVPIDRTLFTTHLGTCALECDKEEISLITADGNALPVLFSCCALDLSGAPGIGVVLTDISYRKLVESRLREAQLQARMAEEREQSADKLRESENRFRLLAETMLQGVVHQDAQGIIISMNPAAEQILGKSCEEFLGNSSVSVEHHTIRENGEPFPGEEHPTMVALRTGLPVRSVVMGVFNPKLGEYRWIGIDAVPVFRHGEACPAEVYSVFGDITERKKAERQLQESEQRIQQALHVSRSFTFEWLPLNDQVIRSDSCAAILKITGNEPVNDTGENFFRHVHQEDRARFVQTLRDLTPAANSYITEYRYLSNDGSEITLEETAQATFDAAGTMIRLVGVSTDISVRKRAEEELKKFNAELELRVEQRTSDLANSMSMLRAETAERIKAMEALHEKERMLIQQSRQAAMGEMIGNIAHQWRQPLNTLGLYTQSLGAFYGMPNFNKEFLDNSIAKSMEIIRHMSKTIDDFRDYFKPEKAKSDFLVVEAIKHTLLLLEGNFNNPKIVVDIVEHCNPVINGYQNEFAQVFLNILNNARDAIIERDIADARITITISSEADGVVVTVADNAGGVPEEIIDKVFDPYFTTKGPQLGTGIGLFMSKTIIEKNMGGRLTVCNSDNGAEFRIKVGYGTKSQ